MRSADSARSAVDPEIRPLISLAIAMTTTCLSPATPQTSQPPDALVQPPGPAAAMAHYRHALEEYDKTWQSYAAASSAYWTLISDKRQLRNAKRARGEPLSLSDYVLAQPPIYTGPPKPRNPVDGVARRRRIRMLSAARVNPRGPV